MMRCYYFFGETFFLSFGITKLKNACIWTIASDLPRSHCLIFLAMKISSILSIKILTSLSHCSKVVVFDDPKIEDFHYDAPNADVSHQQSYPGCVASIIFSGYIIFVEAVYVFLLAVNIFQYRSWKNTRYFDFLTDYGNISLGIQFVLGGQDGHSIWIQILRGSLGLRKPARGACWKRAVMYFLNRLTNHSPRTDDLVLWRLRRGGFRVRIWKGQ